jgi:hypothetical protein
MYEKCRTDSSQVAKLEGKTSAYVSEDMLWWENNIKMNIIQ